MGGLRWQINSVEWLLIIALAWGSVATYKAGDYRAQAKANANAIEALGRHAVETGRNLAHRDRAITQLGGIIEHLQRQQAVSLAQFDDPCLDRVDSFWSRRATFRQESAVQLQRRLRDFTGDGVRPNPGTGAGN
jgi:hypothetical protein